MGSLYVRVRAGDGATEDEHAKSCQEAEEGMSQGGLAMAR